MMLITSRWHFLSLDCNFRSFLRREFFYPQLCVLIFLKASFAEVQIGLSEAFQIILKLFWIFFLFCIIYHWLWYFKLRYMVYNKYNLHVLNCFIMTLEDIITFACTIFNHTVPIKCAIGFPVYFTLYTSCCRASIQLSYEFLVSFISLAKAFRKGVCFLYNKNRRWSLK